jgi:hypothetical protein
MKKTRWQKLAEWTIWSLGFLWCMTAAPFAGGALLAWLNRGFLALNGHDYSRENFTNAWYVGALVSLVVAVYLYGRQYGYEAGNDEGWEQANKFRESLK